MRGELQAIHKSIIKRCSIVGELYLERRSWSFVIPSSIVIIIIFVFSMATLKCKQTIHIKFSIIFLSCNFLPYILLYPVKYKTRIPKVSPWAIRVPGFLSNSKKFPYPNNNAYLLANLSSVLLGVPVISLII